MFKTGTLGWSKTIFCIISTYIKKNPTGASSQYHSKQVNLNKYFWVGAKNLLGKDQTNNILII